MTPISGWAFGVQTENPLTWLDESYHWWYGDDDLWERAVAANARIETAAVPYRHVRAGLDGAPHSSYPEKMRAQVQLDRQRFATRWRHGNLEGLPA